MSGGAIEVLLAITIPLFAFVVNWRVRVACDYALSSAADFVLAIIAFDLVVAGGSEVFSTVPNSETIREHFTSVFIILFIVSFLMWALGSLPLEHRLSRYYNQSPKRNFYFGASWVIVPFLMAPHILAFVYG